MASYYVHLICPITFNVPVKFNLDPPKIGSPRNKLIFGPTLKILFPLQASHTKKNQWLLRMLLEFTVAYLEKWMTASHDYASAAPRSIWNMHSSQTLHNVCGNWKLHAAGNETTVHCVLLNWRAWVVSRNLGNLLDMPLIQVLQAKFVQGLLFFICGRWSKFFRRSYILP